MKLDLTTYPSITLQKSLSLVIRTAEKPVVALMAHRGHKNISAMLRVKNEEEYLYPAVMSIIDIVDEVVIIDNCSTDSTPQIIANLQRQFPAKIRSFVYPHKVARYGEENQRLASTYAGRKSPSLLMNFYNWSLAKCRCQFVLKWDGDTIATTAFGEALKAFKHSPKQAMWICGANLHANRTHLIRGHPFETIEPRIFNRRLAYYDNSLGYCERLRSPFVGRFIEYSQFYQTPAYIHMKFCKRDRYSNMSPDLQQQMSDIDPEGDPLDEFLKREIELLNLTN